MAYIVDPINNTLIDDSKPFENSLNKLQNKPTRKPGALPPGTNTIKYSDGGKVKDMNKVVANTQKNADFDKKYPPLVKTKALIDEGLVDQKDLEVSYDPATKLFTNKTRDIAFKDYNQATQYNASIGVVRKKLPPKKFDNNDPTTYPSNINQQRSLGTWELMLQSAKDDPKDPNSIDTKKMIRKIYNNPKRRKELGDDELKLIGRHKSQIAKQIASTPMPTPIIDPGFFKRITETTSQLVRDPETELAEKRFNQMLEEDRQKRNRLEGIETILGVKAR